MKREIKIEVVNIRGEASGMSLFKYFDDGVRKRLPKNLAKEYRKVLLDNIDSNRFSFELNSSWTAYKKRIGADPRPFIMFGYYKKAISIITKEGHLSVGFPKSSIHPRAKMSMVELAIKLEYGDLAKGIPARPLWRRTSEDFLSRKNKISQIIQDSFK